MPSVRGIQEKYGKDKFEVLMLSVDQGFSMPNTDPAKDNRKKLQSQNVDWDNVLLPHGFDDTHRKFNVDGYGLTLVGPDGIVRGIGIYPDDVKQIMVQMKF
jgi:hypothetical protein